MVTVLFADVTGFTRLAETVDPEPLRDLINACFERLVPCVEHFGGTVDKFMGDEVMALFGAPIAHDNDPVRAVRAAIDMRIALAAFNAERGTTLEAHCGINSGLVLAGPVGAGSRAEYSVMGDAVNVASRLAETAAPGEILVGPNTHRLAGQFFSCEPTGQVRLRGRNEPLAVWRVIGEATTGAADPGTSSGRLIGSPLVGRDEERDRFLAALARTHAGEGGVLFVLGEAGLGKSRLAAEVRRVCPAGLLWLEGRSQSFGMDLSYLPFREILRQAAGMDDCDPDEARLEKLARLVEPLQGGENPWTLPSLAVLLGLSLPEGLTQRVASLDGETMGRQVVRSLLLLLRRLAEEQSLVLLLEDIHWLDPSSLAFLKHLLPLSREVPLLVVLVGRPDTDSPTAALRATARECCGDRVEQMLLAPLHPEDMRALVRNLVGGEDLPRDLRETVAAKAEGNPLFVEELIRALIELGGLVQGEHGGLRVTDAAAEITLPATLNGVITARIDRLPEGQKEVLRTAAVIGRRFSYGLLAAVAPDPQSLAADLARLRERELVQGLHTESERNYAFKHILVQEAAYEGLLLRRRRELHGAVAAAIERLHSDRLEEFLGPLAYHCTKAEDWDRAQGYLLGAGKQAGRIAADPETLSHFERALDAYLRAHGGTWGDLVSDEGIDWFVEWTNALAAAVRVRSVTSAIKAFHENVSAALGPEDPRVLAVAVALARAYGQGGALHEQEAILEAAIASRDGVNGRGDADLLRALVLLGNARLYQDKFVGAEAAYLRALNLARELQDLDTRWHLSLCGSLGWLYLEGGRYEEAREVLSEGLALPKQEVGLARGGVLFNLAWLHWALGDYAEAERYARACMPEATVPLAEAAARDLIGMIHRSQGDYAAAQAQSVAAMETAEAFDPSDAVLVDIMSNVAEAQLQTGAHGEAEGAAMRALALVRDMPGAGRCQTIPAYCTLAGVALARGQLAEAERLLAESETVGAEAAAESHWVQPHWMQPEVLYRRAQLRRAQGRAQEAEDLLEEACRLLDQRRGSPHPRAEAMRAEWTETAP